MLCFEVPGAFRRFIPTRETPVLDLDACFFLPRDHDEIISVSVSDALPSSKALACFDNDCSRPVVPSYHHLRFFPSWPATPFMGGGLPT